MHPLTLQNKTILKVLVLLAIIFSNTDVLASADALIKKHQIPENKLSIILEDSESGERLISINPSTTRSPGSVTKIFTAFSAFDVLGKDFKWKTEAYIEQRAKKQKKIDRLLIKGGGDPTFSLDDLEGLVKKIRSKGIDEISEGIYFDLSFFKQRKKSTGSFDQSPLRPYNSMHSALIVNSNRLDLKFSFTPEQKKLDVSPLFLPSDVIIQNNLSIGAGNCSDFRSQVSFREQYRKKLLTIVIEGVYPSKCLEKDHDLAITKTEHYFFGAFKKLWLESGGKINGYFKKHNKNSKDILIAEIVSDDLSGAIRLMLKESDNLSARNIFLSLGYQSNRKEYRLMRRLSYESMKKNKIHWHYSNFIENGSGLSRKTKIKPESVISLIQKIDEDDKYSEIESMLPVSGIDGTLKNIYRSETLRGQMRLKTGTLNGVRCLAGFITSKSGKEYRFVFMHNNFDEYDYNLRLFSTELLEMIIREEVN